MDADGLVARTAGGEVNAFAALVRQNQSAVRNYLRRLARGDHALADDLAQDTFLEAYRKIGQFRGDGTFLGWLFRIAHSRFLMEVRKRKLDSVMLEQELILPDPSIGSDAKIDLERALSSLAMPERAALTLHFAFGCSHEEVSSVLGAPLGTVKSHILRGRERLKAQLGDKDAGATK